jgi:hypothetical protein
VTRMVGKSKYLRHKQASSRSVKTSSHQANNIEELADNLLDKLIARAVRGQTSPFPVDKTYNWKGSFQATFDAGDKQILLWAIEDCAQKRHPIPEWAAQKLHEIMFRGVARGEIACWKDAFGPIRVKQHRTIQTLKHMVAIWLRIRKLKDEDQTLDYDGLFEEVQKEFFPKVGIVKLKKYYQDMQTSIKNNLDVWN